VIGAFSAYAGSGIGRVVTDLGTLGGQKGSSSQFQFGTNFRF
jgi:hypothetical protein